MLMLESVLLIPMQTQAVKLVMINESDEGECSDVKEDHAAHIS